MIRKIVRIDEGKCSGCGLCARACKEAAIVVTAGKARLVREDYCDGLGNCLPACPMDAITIEEREAAAFDAAAVEAHIAGNTPVKPDVSPATGCPGTRVRLMAPGTNATAPMGGSASMLRQWPVQIRLVSPSAAFLDGADLLIAADCTAYAYGSFHRDFIRGRVTLIGCPKLDDTDYAERLGAILSAHDVRSITVTRMEVPCCSGLARAVREAVRRSGRDVPCRTVVISSDGRILQE